MWFVKVLFIQFQRMFMLFAPPLFAIYYAFAFLFEENLSQVCIRNHKKCWSKPLFLQRIQHQNALHFALKRTAFCIKTHCNQHQNALHLAPKRIAFSTKTQGILHQNAENRHKKRRVKGYLWANCPLEMKNGLVVFVWAFSCAQHPKFMPKRPYFMPDSL